VLSTLFLNPPSYDGFDGGAGARYQARREIRSFWFPTWLAQPAAMVPGSKLIDAPPHDLDFEASAKAASEYELVFIHTSSPTLPGDAQLCARIKELSPSTRVGLVGPLPAVLPVKTLEAAPKTDFVCGREYDETCVELANGIPFSQVHGITWRDGSSIVTNPERGFIEDFDALPSVMDVYARDLEIERYYIGYLQHPYISHYTGRGCPARCSFCLWPQTVGGHRYRARSPQAVAKEMAHAQALFPQVKEFFFDDDTFTAYQPRAREIAEALGQLNITWSCNARANVSYETLRVMKENGLRLLLVGYESGDQGILDNIRKGVSLEQARRFTADCHRLGIRIHGTFILGLPGETKATIQQTAAFAKELDPWSLQVSLAAPYPGTELHRQAKEAGWLPEDADGLVDPSGRQLAALEYPDLDRETIFSAVEDFYRTFYFRPRPILRMMGDMMRDRQEFQRRIREGVEFFRFLNQRKVA